MKKKSAEKRMRKKILVNALSKNLEKMSKSPWVRSLKDGKDLVCPFCDQPIQPCKSNPSAMCEKMLRAGTEGKNLEEALKDCINNQYGICLSCGKKISTQHLKKHPTAEICTQCFRKGHKKSARKHARP
jgi:RNA polymerase-binding transcription factor DksA